MNDLVVVVVVVRAALLPSRRHLLLLKELFSLAVINSPFFRLQNFTCVLVA